MANLPEQAHQRGAAVATIPPDDPYALDQTMVTLPRLRLSQYQSQAFKRKLVDFGALYIAIGQDDMAPVVVAEAAEPLTAPVEFYVHRLERGYNYAEDPANPKNLTFGRLGGTFSQALAFTDGDPRRVFQKFDYTLTIPAYPLLPVRFLMTSRWGGNAARWMNTQIGLMVQQDQRVLDHAFQIQVRQTHNDKGDFGEAVLGLADVKGKDAEAHQELVQKHADLLSSAAIQDDYEDAEIAADETAAAPSLA